jgi:hypothetical protein
MEIMAHDIPMNHKSSPPGYSSAILVLDDGSNRLALVTLDLGRSFGPPFMDALRQKWKQTHPQKA